MLAADCFGQTPADTDEARSGWKYRRSVTITASGPGFAALPLPPEIAGHTQRDLRDLRLIGTDGREVPFVVDRKTDRQAAQRWEGDLTDTRSERRLRTVWMVDFREPRRFDTIELRIDDTDFAKRFRVEASDDATGWRELAADAGVFDRQWNFRVHHTAIQLPSPQTARYLRLTADDQRSAPVSIRGVTARVAREVAGERWSRRADIGSQSTAETTSRYRLDLPPGLPVEKVEIESDDVGFSRQVRLIEERRVSGRQVRNVLGRGAVYRLKLDDDSLAGESLSFTANAPKDGVLYFEVENSDSPPLRDLRVTVSGVATRLLFPAAPDAAGSWTLYYGNTATRAAVYDLEMLKVRLGLSPQFIATELGPETENPRYRPVPPMQFVATHGAATEARQWKLMRRLALPAREDIYTATLAATDLGALRADLGDLRIVDGEGRQVPFIIEPGIAEREVALRFEPDPRPARRGEGRISRYRLTVNDEAGKATGLPLRELRLDFAEQFFSRPARVVVPGRDPRRGERVLFDGKLARGGNERGPVRIVLDGERRSEVFLEIEEGDNAPLTLSSVKAAVAVPRVVFKLKPAEGGYRLLFGNAKAASPRYDIQSLRQELLAYSATPVRDSDIGPLELNAGYRRSAADYFQTEPPTLALWGVLLVAVVGLLALTVRLLKKPTT